MFHLRGGALSPAIGTLSQMVNNGTNRTALWLVALVRAGLKRSLCGSLKDAKAKEAFVTKPSVGSFEKHRQQCIC